MPDRMNRTRLFMVIAVVAFIVTASIVLNIVLRNDHGDVSDDGKDDGGDQVIFDELDVRIDDAFTTDKLTSMIGPPLFTQVFLVLDLTIGNPLDDNISLFLDMIMLRTDRGEVPPTFMTVYVGRALPSREDMRARSNISGYLHFAIFPEEELIGLQYRENAYNMAFYLDLRNLTLEERLWKTPLAFEITGCGRDPAGSGKERYLFFELQVTDPGDNASHFQCWLLDLVCMNSVHLDGLFVEEPENEIFRPGWNVTYKVYFDIPVGSPDRPKVLYQVSEGMYLDIDESLYIDLM